MVALFTTESRANSETEDRTPLQTAMGQCQYPPFLEDQMAMDRMALLEQEVLPQRELQRNHYRTIEPDLTIHAVVLPPTCPASSSDRELARRAKPARSFTPRPRQLANTFKRCGSKDYSWAGGMHS